jgi:putative intracellular protease/amidase
MDIAILLFDGLTALDAIGPYEVLKSIPGSKILTVASEKGLKRTDGGLGICADYSFREVSKADILVVPGGLGTRVIMHDPSVQNWVRDIHDTTKWTTSVCTGALVLGAAGLLRERKATTHWTQLERLREFGAEPVSERVVFQGKVVTCAGVSAGIDMALRLVHKMGGDLAAQMVQLAMEYDPDPPFHAGSPDKAPPEVVEAVRQASRDREKAFTGN